MKQDKRIEDPLPDGPQLPPPGGYWAVVSLDTGGWIRTCVRVGNGCIRSKYGAEINPRAVRDFDRMAEIHAAEIWPDELRRVIDELDSARARVKSLTEAGDRLASKTIPNGNSHEEWNEAKGQA